MRFSGSTAVQLYKCISSTHLHMRMRVPQYAQQTVAEQESEAADRNWRPDAAALVQRPAGAAGQRDVQQSRRIAHLRIAGGHPAAGTAGRGRLLLLLVRCGVGRGARLVVGPRSGGGGGGTAVAVAPVAMLELEEDGIWCRLQDQNFRQEKTPDAGVFCGLVRVYNRFMVGFIQMMVHNPNH